MNGLRLDPAGDEQVRLSGIDWVTAACLLEVPNILPQAKSGPARERLFPMASAGDAKLDEDWRQLVVPELERLFASAGEIMAKDIEGLGEKREITFPVNHCNAWISAINQARLILGAQQNVTETDMEERDFADPNDPKPQALLRIHVLGYVLQVFVEFVSAT